MVSNLFIFNIFKNY